MYIFEICTQISQSNIKFEENIFVLTVLSYRKIPTGREEVFTLGVFWFCELIFIIEADKSVYKLLKWNCSNISIDTITWIWFGLAGTSCSADLHLIICSRILRILSRFPKKIQVLKKKISHLWWKNAQASVMYIKVVSKWKRHLTWDYDSDWGCKMSCQT